MLSSQTSSPTIFDSARHTLSLRSQDTVKPSGTRLTFYRKRAARNKDGGLGSRDRCTRRARVPHVSERGSRDRLTRRVHESISLDGRDWFTGWVHESISRDGRDWFPGRVYGTCSQGGFTWRVFETGPWVGLTGRIHLVGS